METRAHCSNKSSNNFDHMEDVMWPLWILPYKLLLKITQRVYSNGGSCVFGHTLAQSHLFAYMSSCGYHSDAHGWLNNLGTNQNLIRGLVQVFTSSKVCVGGRGREGEGGGGRGREGEGGGGRGREGVCSVD